MYSLVEIEDAHSSLKSPIAKQLVRSQFLGKFGIRYISMPGYAPSHYCENTLLPERDCHQKIHDVFHIIPVPGKGPKDRLPLIVGNTCISRLIEAHIISNISKVDFHFILKTMRIINVCFLCFRSCGSICHKSCFNGTSKRPLFDSTAIKNKLNISHEIKCRVLSKTVYQLLGGHPTVQNMFSKTTFTKKDYNCLQKIIEDYSILFENSDKLLQLENNCIVNSIRKQSRYPSVKQLAITEKIIKNYSRILTIDRHCNNQKYLKYGFVY